MAWCMQLVVFVQPFLPGQSMPGLGVCQVIVDAFASSAAQGVAAQRSHQVPVASLPHRQSATAPQRSNTHLIHGSSQITQPIALTSRSGAPPPQVDHHFSHLSCGFCMLYGHAIPPPDTLSVWSPFVFDHYIQAPQFSNYQHHILAADYLKPKSRAPPIFYSI